MWNKKSATEVKKTSSPKSNHDILVVKINYKCTFSEAPPTKNPSTSGCAANSLQFAPLTEPIKEIFNRLD